ncbi:MAG: hypothetical protein BMS9Abin37_2042 [Acidobacteriota bacterium]|nr:MAG: hypothetical protein BMS9Abin37_2042 [Acidobacteriota bacterium]
MKIGIVMSDGYPEPEHVTEYVKSAPFPEGTEIVGRGGDTVEKSAELRGLRFHGFPMTPDYRTAFGDVAGMKQGELVVGFSERVVVFWDAGDREVAHIIRLALMEGKLQKVTTPWGTLRLERK